MSTAPRIPPASDAAAKVHGLAQMEQTWLSIFWRRFRRSKPAMLGLAFFAIVITAAIFAPYIAPFDPNAINLKARNLPPDAAMGIYFGTDELGRDVFSRMLYGSRVSLTVGLTTVVIYVTVGAALGATAGFFGGAVDNVIMRLADVVLAFPFLLAVLTLAAILGPSIKNLIMVVCFVAWPVPARLVRGEVLSIRERDFITAARATGAGDLRIIMRHMLPNSIAPLVVQATLAVAGLILTEATLSFLGFGVRPPTPTWGNMLSGAQGITVLRTMPWQWMPPGFAIFFTVMAINFIGDALRDALDPRLKT